MASFNVISAKNNYGQDVTIRTVVRDGVTWYVASDFCKSIDYPNTYSTKAYISKKNRGLIYSNGNSYIVANYDGLKELDGKFRNKRTIAHYKLLMEQITEKTKQIDPNRLEARFLAPAADFGATPEAEADAEIQQSTPQAKEEDVTKYIKDNDERIGDILSTLINCYELLIDALKTIQAKRGEI